MHGCKYLLHRANHNEQYSANSKGDYKYSAYKPRVKHERHSLSNPQATAATESSQKRLLAYAFALSATKWQVGKVMSDFSWDRSIEAPSIRVKLVGALPKLWRPAGKQKLFWGASLGIT